MEKYLSRTATILTVREKLYSAESYVRAVLENLDKIKREWGDAQVRIGITKGYLAPDYLVETIIDPETGQPMTVAIFSGKTHRPVKGEENYRFWSESPMTRSEVSDLIGEIRNFQPKKSRVSGL